MPCPCTSLRHQQHQPNPPSLLSCSHFLCRSVPSVLWFLIPKGVSGSADTTGIRAMPTPFIHHPLRLHPTPTCAYAEEGSISAVATAKHHTTKEMRTSDSNHQEGRWQNKGGRRWSERQECAKGGKKERERAFFSLSPFFHTFFFFFYFLRIHQAPLDTCLPGVAVISPEGGVPFSPCMPLFTEPFPFSRQFTFQNRRWADQRRSLTMRPFISGWHGMLSYYTVRFHWS